MIFSTKKITNFWGDLTDDPAKTKTLLQGDSLEVNSYDRPLTIIGYLKSTYGTTICHW